MCVCVCFFNVTHAHREIDHCVASFFRAALGVKAGGREDMSVVVGLIIRLRIQSLTALESEYSKSPEEDNGSDAGLVSRAQIPLILSP